MDYIIAMKFITWVIIMWIASGYYFIKSCERDAQNQMLDEELRDKCELWIQDYNSRNFAGRVVFTITMGARLMAFPFGRKGE